MESSTMNATIQSHDNSQSVEYVKLIVKTSKETHAMNSSAQRKAQRLVLAKKSSERTDKIQVLQTYINDYRQFIESTSQITGLRVCHISIEDILKIDLDEQLSIMEGIVYLKEALNSKVKIVFKQCLRKLMKQSGFFTEAQLDVIDAFMDTSKHDRWLHHM